ncbi:hypothetical protein JW868_02760 [Candidatus Woesearchaeota archaeon]|nr:hypothetical protein [Candidatus Woesearchaeota archaeon]
MELRVDHHFHPNLSRFDYPARKKCRRVWKEFKKNGINAVICTEHIYRNPREHMN